jgi:HAD superfamily hydrolase (TIGR01458 family)
MIKGVLIDLSGTIHIGHTPLPGAIEALLRLRDSGLRLKFVTNTSRRTRKTLHNDLCRIGFDIAEQEMFTAPLAVRRYLEAHGLHPYLLVHPNLMPEFEGIPINDPDAVVVGDAEDDFSFKNMNEAFRLLKQGAQLLATGRTRYFEGPEGLELDAGPYVAALEYAAGITAIVLGKPAAAFFVEAAEEIGLEPSKCVMVGDDAEADVAAAIGAGLEGILVQTGKYRKGDEAKLRGQGFVAPNFAAAVNEIITRAG